MRFDETAYRIGVASQWQYFYNIQRTERSAADQVCVTIVWRRWRQVETGVSLLKQGDWRELSRESLLKFVGS